MLVKENAAANDNCRWGIEKNRFQDPWWKTSLILASRSHWLTTPLHGSFVSWGEDQRKEKLRWEVVVGGDDEAGIIKNKENDKCACFPPLNSAPFLLCCAKNDAWGFCLFMHSCFCGRDSDSSFSWQQVCSSMAACVLKDQINSVLSKSWTSVSCLDVSMVPHNRRHFARESIDLWEREKRTPGCMTCNSIWPDVSATNVNCNHWSHRRDAKLSVERWPQCCHPTMQWRRSHNV